MKGFCGQKNELFEVNPEMTNVNLTIRRLQERQCEELQAALPSQTIMRWPDFIFARKISGKILCVSICRT